MDSVLRAISITRVVALLIVAAAMAGAARGEEKFANEKPFDLVTLRQSAGGDVLKVRRLELPGRRVPSPFPAGRLELRLMDDPTEPYEVLWSDIAKVELFEQMLLAEGAKLTNGKKFDEAFDYFSRLHSDFPETPRLEEATSRYLQQNAAAVYRNGEYDRALAMLASLYEEQPSAGGLARSVDAVAEKIINERLKNRDFHGARSVIDVVDEQFTDLDLTVVDKWRARFQKGADDQVRKGAESFREQKYREARAAALQAQAIWPEHKQAQQLLNLIQRDNPAVIIGVRTTASQPLQPRIDSPASLRSSFLAAPTLTRIIDYSPEGGIYSSPIGAVGLDATGRELTISVLDYPANSPEALDAPAAVARWLLKASDPKDWNHQPSLAAVVGSVLTPEPDLLVVGLSRPHIRPEALLQEALLRDCKLAPPFGTYVPQPIDDETLELRAAAEGMTVSVVEERQFTNDDAAIAALNRGDIDALAEVAPWQVPALRSKADLVVGQYRLPTVHVLIPTHAKKILDSREFRRALAYGINRERILKETIQGGSQLPGCQLVSGPFPAGLSLSDPVRYGYNDAVRPRPYEPRLAALLTGLSWTNLKKAEHEKNNPKKEGEEKDEEAEEEEFDPGPFPKLRLAHSSDPIARTACRSIQAQLAPIGVPIELVELSEAELHDPDGDFDLRYAQLAAWEPVVDAQRILGRGGIAGRCSDPMYAALQQLDAARNWNETLTNIRNVHELAAGDLPVIPLWQTPNFYAFRRELAGLPASTIHLYQSVADWRKEYRTAGR